jgi:hypothetical protein
MDNFFRNIPPEKIEEFLNSEERCLFYIASEKWKDGFKCRICGHTNFCKGKKPYSRRCTRCKHEESATAHTIFHGCRLPLTQAFRMAYAVCHLPEISTYELSRQFDTRQMTCWKFKKRIMECLKERGRLMLINQS